VALKRILVFRGIHQETSEKNFFDKISAIIHKTLKCKRDEEN
jgi:hypothetical protein